MCVHVCEFECVARTEMVVAMVEVDLVVEARVTGEAVVVATVVVMG